MKPIFQTGDTMTLLHIFYLSLYMILDIGNEISLDKVQKKLGMYVTTEALHLNLSFP